MRPLIAITPSFSVDKGPPVRQRLTLNAAYADAILLAGGMPWIVPTPADTSDALLDEIVARADGLLFTGGPDIDPRNYGQSKHARTEILHPRRDRFDLALFAAADARKKPILSVCLGCQIANVARGGCLVQHVDDIRRESPIQHYMPDGSSAYHDVVIEPDSTLAKIVGKTQMEVNSRHHQVLDPSQIGDELRPVALAPDGIVEAAENMEGRFLLAVQWHPEDLIDRPEHLKLFQALVAAAR